MDQHLGSKTLIIADLSNDLTYAETLFERFGKRVIGLQIGRHGDGLTNEPLIVNGKGGNCHRCEKMAARTCSTFCCVNCKTRRCALSTAKKVSRLTHN